MTIALDPDNEHRVTAALEALQARPFMTGERGSAFHTRLGGLEIMRNTDGIGDYEAWSRHATTIRLTSGLELQVGRPSDLLLSKEAAGRVKDTEALPRIPPKWDEVVLRGERESGKFIAFWLKDHRVIAGMNVNIWDVNEHVQALIRSRRPIDIDQLSDPDTPLDSLYDAAELDDSQ